MTFLERSRWLGSTVGAAIVLMAVLPGAAAATAGDFDRAFGTDGTYVTGSQYQFASTADAHGRALVAGVDHLDVVVVTRLDRKGDPDPGFGIGGHAKWQPDAAPYGPDVRDIAVLPDGRIAVVGELYWDHPDMFVVVFGPDGESPRSVVGDIAGTELITGAEVLDDGRLLVAGTTFGPPHQDAAVWRVDPDSGIDPGFGVDGMARLDLGKPGEARDIAVLPDGRILVAGNESGSTGAIVWRLRADGGLDPTFDGDGWAEIDRYGEKVRAVAPLPDGRIMLAGVMDYQGVEDRQVGVGAWRLKADGGDGSVDGALDPSFDSDGWAMIGGYDGADVHDLARQPDGAILVAGRVGLQTDKWQAVLWRVRPDGGRSGPGYQESALDVGFADLGVRTLPGIAAYSVTALPTRRILVSGHQRLTGFVSRLLGNPVALTIARAGAGEGTVVSAPAGIDCGLACSFSFDVGSRVRLGAVPASGSIFAGWEGDGCTGAGDCETLMEGDRAITARFEPAADPPTHVVPPAFGVRTGVTLKASRTISRGRLVVTVRNTNAFAIRGSLAVRWPRGVKSRRFAVPAKNTVRVALRMPRRALRTRAVRVTLRATVTDPAGHTRRITRIARVRTARSAGGKGR